MRKYKSKRGVFTKYARRRETERCKPFLKIHLSNSVPSHTHKISSVPSILATNDQKISHPSIVIGKSSQSVQDVRVMLHKLAVMLGIRMIVFNVS